MQIDISRASPQARSQPTEPTYVDVSVVVPIFNERHSLSTLVSSLMAVLTTMGCTFEILAIDDGSSDGSRELLRDLAVAHPQLRVIEFVKNFGQTAALMAGFDNSRGDIVVTIDADLQNSPSDIPALVAKLGEGYDVVSGWRVERKDAALSRRLPSWLANRVISQISGVRLKDYGCTLRPTVAK